MSLLVRDHPEAWGWLAVALLTGRIIIDALVVDDNNVVTLVQRTVAVLGDDTIATWGGVPRAAQSFGAGLQGMAERHVLGGLQAAERSKSFDLLELYDDEAEDVAIQEARGSVLQAEGARAEQLWALAGLDDQGVDDAWRKFRELRAWRHSEVTDTSIDPEAWLRDLAGGLTTSTRAIVHMMVGEGLELFWAVDGGERCDVDVVQAPIKPLLSSLEPWRTDRHCGRPAGVIRSQTCWWQRPRSRMRSPSWLDARGSGISSSSLGVGCTQCLGLRSR